MNFAASYEKESVDSWGVRAGTGRVACDVMSQPIARGVIADERGKPQAAAGYGTLRHYLIENKALGDHRLHLWAAISVDGFPNGCYPINSETIGIAWSNFGEVFAAPWSLFAKQPQASVEFYSLTIDDNVNYNLLLNDNPEASTPAWVNKLYEEECVRASRASLRFLFQEIGTHLRKGETTVVDQVLKRIQMERLAPELVMGVVRVTAIAKGRLPSWRDASLRAYQELDRRGLPAKEIMIGLPTGTDEDSDTPNR